MSSDININGFNSRIFESLSPEEFNGLALDLFQYQLRENKIYEEYVGYLGKDSKEIFHYNEIPFLPIGFYKSHKVVSGNFDEEMVFLSSGTSGMSSSTHHIRDLALYRQSFMQTFKEFYGEAGSYRILGLLPSYLEREGSSLVYMVKAMIDAGNHPESGFFLHDHGRLAETLQTLNSSGHPTLLIGVSFALLDFAEKYHISLGDNILIMETGGMKGRREEMTREALHQQLKKAFHKEYIHSEYGMTELLSQAYSKGEGHFQCPPWMKIMIRDIQDPFSYLPPGKTGAINIIDLANIHSCAFIETQDIGRTHPDGSFEVLGRTDSSDVRGCSLLVVN